MLSKISHTKKGKYYDLTYIMNLKKAELMKEWVEWLWLEAEGCAKWGDIGPRLQTSTYEMNKFWGYNIVNNTMLYLKFDKKENLECSHHPHKKW